MAHETPDDEAGRLMRCTPSHAKWLRLHLHEIGNTIAFAWRKRPDVQERFLRNCQSIGVTLDPPAHTAELEVAAQQLDLDEDQCQHLWDLEPVKSPETLARWIRAKERGINADMHELRSLIALHEQMTRGAA